MDVDVMDCHPCPHRGGAQCSLHYVQHTYASRILDIHGQVIIGTTAFACDRPGCLEAAKARTQALYATEVLHGR